MKGKTNSALDKWPASVDLAEIFSTISGVFSSIVNTFSESSADSVDSEGPIQPKCPCRISSRGGVSVPAKAIFIQPRPLCLS